MTEGSTSSQTDFSMASEFAIRVALQTVKERCVSLHQRLQLLEEENQVLRNQDEMGDFNKSDIPEVDMERLKQKVSQLTSQNQRLNEHIQIISKENNQLWSRLSQMSKDRSTSTGSNSSSPRKQTDKESNLIRSRTFTQHSPNPNLRHTVVPFESIDGENTEDPILEEQINNQISSLQVMRDVAITQQTELKSSLQLLQYKILNQKCQKCMNKPETVEENQQTSISPTLVTPKENSKKSTATDTKDHIDILAEKRAADDKDRVCPLCGQIFSQAVRFEDFVRHVEIHFIDEDEEQSDSDISLENNYEFVTNTIGNF
ncbi:spn-F family protein [Megaselia abdita]